MKNVARFTRQMLCIFCASFLLVGCGYFDAPEPVLEKPVEQNVQEPVRAEPVNIEEAVANSTDGAVQLFGWDDAELASAVAEQPLIDDTNTAYELDQQKREQSYDAQEVATSDAVAVGERGFAPVTTLETDMTAGRFYAADPSVEIYPFDDMPMPLASSAYQGQGERALPPMKDEDFAVIDGRDDFAIVYFDHNSSALSGAAQNTVRRMANGFNKAAGEGFTVAGHASVRANYADEKQKRIVNLKISMDRAFNVARALISRGVPAHAVRVIGWGDTKPAQNLDGKSAEQAARRVEISR